MHHAKEGAEMYSGTNYTWRINAAQRAKYMKMAKERGISLSQLLKLLMDYEDKYKVIKKRVKF